MWPAGGVVGHDFSELLEWNQEVAAAAEVRPASYADTQQSINDAMKSCSIEQQDR